jgi:hypothetical protein
LPFALFGVLAQELQNSWPRPPPVRDRLTLQRLCQGADVQAKAPPGMTAG